MIKTLMFVAREFFPDHDDEIVEGYDGLNDDFGGDSYCVSANALYLGFSTRKYRDEAPAEEGVDYSDYEPLADEPSADEPLADEPEAEEILQLCRVSYTCGGGYGSTVRPGKNSRRCLIGDHGCGIKDEMSYKTLVLTHVCVNGRLFKVGRAV